MAPHVVGELRRGPIAPVGRRAQGEGRDGIEIAGTAVLTIPIEMRVGALQETITVTGETPVVDVQSTKRETVLSQEVIEAIPATRTTGAECNRMPIAKPFARP